MLAANCSQWLVLPTPGVPVIIILGWALEGMFVSLELYSLACLCIEHTLCRSIKLGFKDFFPRGD